MAGSDKPVAGDHDKTDAPCTVPGTWYELLIHISVLPPISIIGFGLTVTVTSSVPEHPASVVPVT